MHVRIDTPCAMGAGRRTGGSGMVLDRARGLEENGAGPSGGVGERSIFNNRGQGHNIILHGHILPHIGYDF